ncbi:hypothetical protein [Candidatus Sororendozoicomonas aggregata]|uniref:hypothetical protein n=1 Tax=Candidatus Sororendozoicomonas aggregata TaxID=3073239 RepID=UPI002ED56388
MSIKSVLRARKFMAAKPVVFITGILTLSIMANAYSLNDSLYIDDVIPLGKPHYSKNGYTLKPSGRGDCMYGVYNPASCASAYETESCYVRIHYASSRWHWCVFKHSSQDFNIINNDTGKIVASFQWFLNGWKNPVIRRVKDPEHITTDVTNKPLWYHVKNKLNIYTYKW